MRKVYIKDFYYNISIKTKLLLIILILMICSIVFMGYLSYQSYARVFRDKSVDNMKKNVDEYTTILSERVGSLINLSQKILLDDKIYDINKEFLNNSENNKSLAETSLQINLNMYLHSYLLSRQEFDLIIFHYNGNGKNYYVFNDNYGGVRDISPKGDMFDKAKEGKGDPAWYLDIEGGSLKGIYLERSVINAAYKEIGTIAFKIREDYLFGTIRKYLANKVQSVSVYSDTTRLFYYNTFDPKLEEAALKLLSGSKPNNTDTLNFKGDKIYMFYNLVPPLNWKFAVYISSDIMLADLKKVLFVTIILCALTLPVWLLLIHFLYKDIIKPINILVESMDKIEKGETGITVDIKRNDELGYVFKTFNKMSQQINNLINNVYKEKLAMKDAEIKALQAQINPHFLYNTLETINWKAKLYGVDDISEMVTALSSIIDANIDRNNEKMIPIKKELEYIDNYNLLIQKRFGKKIAFVKSIEDVTLEFNIPRLLIQPLIENAIYHGLETKKGGGTVELIITVEENMVLIIVADDGTGIDDDVLKSLKASLDKNVENQYESRTKIGIMNVHKRIKLIYGEEYGLKIFSEAGKGTTIILKLPFRENRGV